MRVKCQTSRPAGRTQLIPCPWLHGLKSFWNELPKMLIMSTWEILLQYDWSLGRFSSIPKKLLPDLSTEFLHSAIISCKPCRKPDRMLGSGGKKQVTQRPCPYEASKLTMETDQYTSKEFDRRRWLCWAEWGTSKRNCTLLWTWCFHCLPFSLSTQPFWIGGLIAVIYPVISSVCLPGQSVHTAWGEKTPFHPSCKKVQDTTSVTL